MVILFPLHRSYAYMHSTLFFLYSLLFKLRNRVMAKGRFQTFLPFQLESNWFSSKNWHKKNDVNKTWKRKDAKSYNKNPVMCSEISREINDWSVSETMGFSWIEKLQQSSFMRTKWPKWPPLSPMKSCWPFYERLTMLTTKQWCDDAICAPDHSIGPTDPTSSKWPKP